MTLGETWTLQNNNGLLLPRIQTPKNSIVALDFEHGALASVTDGYGGYVSSDAEKKQIQRQFYTVCAESNRLAILQCITAISHLH